MNLEKEIKAILFSIGQEIILHKIDSENIIIEIDYDKYTADIMDIIIDDIILDNANTTINNILMQSNYFAYKKKKNDPKNNFANKKPKFPPNDIQHGK